MSELKRDKTKVDPLTGGEEPEPAEVVGDHSGEAVVVIDHQDALGHDLSIGPARPRCHGQPRRQN